MPYIKAERRREVEVPVPIVPDVCVNPNNAGELNYAITMLCTGYLRDKGVRYTTFNEIVGALECAKLEFYRRAAVPYEDTKIAENGDVYDPA